MTTDRSPSPLWLGLDVVAIILFVLAGRWTLGDDLPGLLLDGWPFVLGVVIGWCVMRAWRHPRTVVWTGIGVWLIAVGTAMVLRAVTGASIDSRFVFLSVIGLGAFLMGWRAVVWILDALFGKVPEDVEQR